MPTIAERLGPEQTAKLRGSSAPEVSSKGRLTPFQQGVSQITGEISAYSYAEAQSLLLRILGQLSLSRRGDFDLYLEISCRLEELEYVSRVRFSSEVLVRVVSDSFRDWLRVSARK